MQFKIKIKGVEKEITIDENRTEIQYAKKIVSGEYKACVAEILSCKRFLEDLERQKDDDFPYVYDTTRADRFFTFYQKCPNPDVQGETLVLSEFQYYDYGNVFGFIEKDTGYRRFQEVLDWKARGGFKSTGASVVCLYIMCADAIYPPYQPELKWYESNPNVTVLAVDFEQTKEVRGVAVNMVRNSAFLKKRIKVGNGNNKKTYIKSVARGGDMIAISSEVGNLDGGKPNCIVADEWGGHTEEARLNTLRGGSGKKAQFLLMKISTASDDAVNKPAKKDYDRCIEILNGRIKDDTYFIIIRELDEKDNPADFSLYEKCSPVFRDNTEYARRLLKAVKLEYAKAFDGGSEAQKIEYLIKRTNRWQVASEQKYLTQDMLDMLVASQVPEEEFLQMIQGNPCVLGIDASKVIDLTAESFIFKLPEGKIGIYAHAFMPEDSLYRHQKTDKLPYQSYVEKGLVTLIGGAYIDNEELMQYMCEFEEKNNCEIRTISADAAYAYQLLIQLSAGRTPSRKAYETIECPQTTSVLNEACITFQKLLLDNKIVLCANELFLQHAANCYTEADKGGRVKISKKNKDSHFRIDLMAATMFALRKIDVLDDQNLIQAIASGNFSF